MENDAQELYEMLHSLVILIEDDFHAMTFQSIWQYRKSLLNHVSQMLDEIEEDRQND